MTRRFLVLCVVICVPAQGCVTWDAQVRRSEWVDRIETMPAGGSPRVTVRLLVAKAGVAASVATAQSCQRVRTLTARATHIETPSASGFVNALSVITIGIGGLVALSEVSKPQPAFLAGLTLGIGIPVTLMQLPAFIAPPVVRELEPIREQRLLGSEDCRVTPIAAARVTLRHAVALLDATTDGGGMAYFPGLALDPKAPPPTVFVDDRAVEDVSFDGRRVR